MPPDAFQNVICLAFFGVDQAICQRAPRILDYNA